MRSSSFEAQVVDQLSRRFGRRLLRVESPLRACLSDPDGPACQAALQRLHNPFFLEDQPGSFHTTGWLGAFDATPSPYAVAAETCDRFHPGKTQVAAGQAS